MERNKYKPRRNAQIGFWFILLTSTALLGCEPAGTNTGGPVIVPVSATTTSVSTPFAPESNGQTNAATAETTAVTAATHSISSGAAHTCALNDRSGVECWGANMYGQLGDGTTEDSPVPVQAVGLPEKVIHVSCGDTHTCARTESGTIYCWGDNRQGQLGIGTFDNSASPTAVTRDRKAPRKKKRSASQRRKLKRSRKSSRSTFKSKKIHIPGLFGNERAESQKRTVGPRDNPFDGEFQ